MKKLFALASTALLAGALLLGGCGTDSKTDAKPAGDVVTLKVGATPVPHAEILEFVQPLLEKEGVKLNVVVFNDYVQPNTALADKELDANFFQHVPYLEKFNQEHKTDLVVAANVHVEPMGIYSHKVKNLADIPNGAKVAIPNDVTNGGRALLLLQTEGLIKLKDGGNTTSTIHDIVDNPKNLSFVELEAAQLPRTLDDVTVAVINTNFAIEAGLNPIKDSLAIESKNSPYANILVIRKGEENNPAIQKLVKVLNSKELKEFISSKYDGAVVPAF